VGLAHAGYDHFPTRPKDRLEGGGGESIHRVSSGSQDGQLREPACHDGASASGILQPPRAPFPADGALGEAARDHCFAEREIPLASRPAPAGKGRACAHVVVRGRGGGGQQKCSRKLSHQPVAVMGKRRDKVQLEKMRERRREREGCRWDFPPSQKEVSPRTSLRQREGEGASPFLTLRAGRTNGRARQTRGGKEG